ncbi:class I tRNA ligase family protein [Pseudomonas huanghezhanensis]|uniref:class I tRNA ligase family protein n=1 Tax=Pseudomonas huanghezhanensis TaxID=3002903 RepID=UPI002285A8E4|nr:class I tRNA ligase family protein [Pseudomonas sp. BSw22131]
MSNVLIIAPPPTPNGDLHVGHMAGPYLAADIYARALRSQGKHVNYATGTDDSQTYVVTSALHLGITPESLCESAATEIERSLSAWGISLDGYAPFDDEYKKMVMDFLLPLHNAGKFKLKSVKLPFSVNRKKFMVESFVSGECPICLSQTRGGLCESCGHPNNFDNLLNPRATLPPYEELIYKDAEILVLVLEDYREQLEAFYTGKKGKWRPHILQLMNELFSKALIEFPITYPITWGLPSPFPGTEGQVINAWAEGMAASMYCNAIGETLRAETDASWRVESGNTIGYFLGFDNSYFWGVTHLALLMAHEGKYILPDFIVPNEFYELENSKFSTSRNHLIWARDLLKTVARDYARFYLCLTCPEHNRSNFSLAALNTVIERQLIAPWNNLVNAYNNHQWCMVENAELKRDTLAIQVMKDRLQQACDIQTFSMRRLADWVLAHIDRIYSLLLEKHCTTESLNAQVLVLVEGMALIMIDFNDSFKAKNYNKLNLNTKRTLTLPKLSVLTNGTQISELHAS